MTVTFQESSYSIEEGMLGQVCGQLSSIAATSVTVSLSITGGSAQINEDFTVTSLTLTFQPGIIIGCTTVMAADDSTVEDDEIFTLVLNNLSNPAVQVAGSTTVTIPNRNSKQMHFTYPGVLYSRVALYHFHCIPLWSTEYRNKS